MRNTFYIRGLDGLRFLGSFLVLFHHTERGKILFGYPFGFSFTKGVGDASMTLFFTLSGFLITYILLKEKNKTGTISLPNFYKRRVSRIWPLYYLLVFSSIFFFEKSDLFALPGPHVPTDYHIAIPLYLFQMPNFHVFFSAAMLAALGHLWTIGVEEQFYAISPLIIKRTKNFVKAFVIIISIKIFITIAFAFSFKFLALTIDQLKDLKVLSRFLYNLRFEAFAVGGIAAYVFLEKKEKILDLINRPLVKYTNLVVLLLTMPLGHWSDTLHVVYAVCFSIIIINLATKATPVFFLDNKYIRYLGQISYGIYMYQAPVIYLVSNSLRPYYSGEHLILWNITYSVACFALSIGIAIVSYELVERKIIALARK